MQQSGPVIRKTRRNAWLGFAVVLLAIAVITSLLRRPAVMELPEDFFPTGLSPSLQAELRLARERVLNDPGAESWGRLGEMCMAHELMPLAERYLQQASALAPDEPKWWYLQGVIAESFELEKAIDCYLRASRLNDKVAAVHWRLGRLQARAGRFSEAEQALQLASERSHRNPFVLQAMAQLKVMQGDWNGAGDLLGEVEQDPNAGRDVVEAIRQLLARTLQEHQSQESPESAAARPTITKPLSEPWLAGVVRLAPRIAELSSQADNLATRGQFAAALELYERVLRMDDRASRPQMYHAMVLMNAGETERALTEIKSVCVNFPDDALALSCRAAIEARLSRFDEAISSLQQAVRLKPDFIDAHRALLMLYQQESKRDLAEAQFRTLMTLVPADEELRRQYEEFVKNPGKNQ